MEEKIKFSKSRPYPYYSIITALEVARDIEKLGARNVSEPVLLEQLNIRNPLTRSFSGKVSSARLFGLITTITTDEKNYSLTEMALLILKPKDEENKKKLLVKSFLTPDIYKELCDRFNSKQIPALQTLSNILFHDYGINTNVSKAAAKSFIESAKFVGLLGQDNILRKALQRDDDKVDEVKKLPIEQAKSLQPQQDITQANTSKTISASVELSRGVAIITLPRGGLTNADKERLLDFLKVYIYTPAD